MRALWLQALSVGISCALSLFFGRLDFVRGCCDWAGPLFAGALALCGQAIVAAAVMLGQAGAALCGPVPDLEALPVGHQVALWGSRVAAVLVIARMLTVRPCRGRVAAGAVGWLAGAMLAGLLWSLQVFDGPEWWSVADAAEGASLVAVSCLAGALHWGWARSQQVLVVVAALGAAAAAVFAGTCQGFSVVHQPAGRECAVAAAGLLAGVAALWHARRYIWDPGFWLRRRAGLHAPRAACFSMLVLWPYSLAVLGVDEVAWAHNLGFVAQVLVWVRPGWSGGAMAPWCVAAAMWGSRHSAPWVPCLRWGPTLWWVHLMGIVLYHCLLVGPVGCVTDLPWDGSGAVVLVAVLVAVLLGRRRRVLRLRRPRGTPVWGDFELLHFYPRNWQTGLFRSGHSLVTYVNVWQYWLWFTFTFLINAYFVFIFRALTYRRADMRGRRAVGDKRRSAWPEMFTCAFPLLWCINVLNNSLGILKAVEANGGYALLTVQLSGFQWGWRYGYGELGYARMLLTPVRVGLDSVLRPGRGQGGSLRDACLAEAHFCRAWLATAGLLEVGGAGGIRLGLLSHGLGVTAQGGQNTLPVRRACLDGSHELVMDPVRLLRATGTFALPTHSTVRLLATAEDVTHSWALPSLGLKLDCVPGRLYVSFLHLNREGVYYGQCSELCGWNHYNMPIVLYALAYEHFVMWWELELHAQFAHEVAAHRGNYTLLSLKYK